MEVFFNKKSIYKNIYIYKLITKRVFHFVFNQMFLAILVKVFDASIVELIQILNLNTIVYYHRNAY